MFWPSFNSALAIGNEQHRSVINTVASLLASCVITFALSALIDEDGKLSMVEHKHKILSNVDNYDLKHIVNYFYLYNIQSAQKT